MNLFVCLFVFACVDITSYLIIIIIIYFFCQPPTQIVFFLNAFLPSNQLIVLTINCLSFALRRMSLPQWLKIALFLTLLHFTYHQRLSGIRSIEASIRSISPLGYWPAHRSSVRPCDVLHCFIKSLFRCNGWQWISMEATYSDMP